MFDLRNYWMDFFTFSTERLHKRKNLIIAGIDQPQRIPYMVSIQIYLFKNAHGIKKPVHGTH